MDRINRSLELPIEEIRNLVSYDGGALVWKVSAGEKKAGKRADVTSKDGYMTIYILGNKYPAHRIVFAIEHGRWPEGYLDHKDRDRSNNRIENLREATGTQNCYNTANNRNTSGYRGVVWHRQAKRWQVQIRNSGRKIYIGLFKDYESAVEASRGALYRYCGEFLPEEYRK